MKKVAIVLTLAFTVLAGNLVVANQGDDKKCCKGKKECKKGDDKKACSKGKKACSGDAKAETTTATDAKTTETAPVKACCKKGGATKSCSGAAQPAN